MLKTLSHPCQEQVIDETDEAPFVVAMESDGCCAGDADKEEPSVERESWDQSEDCGVSRS